MVDKKDISPEWLKKPKKGKASFHDIDVEVYEGFVNVDVIELWRDNRRTTLDIEHLMSESKKDIKELTDNEIIDYILKQGLHKITDLAGSIKKNGVRVPLILSYDKKLIDGNRRFLACKYLIKTEASRNEKFTEILVRCLKKNISDDIILKIIAEMNFLTDYKEDWPEEVRAKFAIERFKEFCEELKDEELAYKKVSYFLNISKADIIRFKSVFKMIGEYINFVGKEAKKDAERFAREKFHFFEEFHNKAMVGNKQLQDDVLKESKQLLYKYLQNSELNSTTKVREFVQIVKAVPVRKHLKEVSGTFETARAVYYEYVGPKKVAAKILSFYNWLKTLTKNEKKDISIDLINNLVKEVNKLLK